MDKLHQMTHLGAVILTEYLLAFVELFSDCMPVPHDGKEPVT